jgi:predicted flavoprotein YhiN
VQFNENNISGICIFNLAYLYPEYKNLVISLDLMPELTINELEKLLLKIKKIRLQFQSEEFVSGIFNRNLSSFLIKKCHIDKTCRISEISDDKIHTLAKNIKRLEFKITASSLWKNAQITHGGICGECVDLNLQSKFFKGMYLCGEILDVDGICGGYNLTWAWSSGLWAGKNAAKKSEDIYAENK